MINVTKPYLPPLEQYENLLKGIWERNWLTNHGPLVQELEAKLSEYLGLQNVLFTNNGTIPLQIALKVLDIQGEVITTPFSYVATTDALLWEGITPVFADISPTTLCIDPTSIEAKITSRTKAILATHVYGIPCDVDRIDEIARRYNLKVIYDGAHAFGVRYKGKSIFDYGDISTCSFHATKLFHTIEGGALFSVHEEIIAKSRLFRSFGHIGDDYYTIGVNGKNSEFHAAMGLCLLPIVNDLIASRKQLFDLYKQNLDHRAIEYPYISDQLGYNYAYFPIILKSEDQLLSVKQALYSAGINARRYFYPSLNTLPFLDKHDACPVSEDIALRVLCLPFYPGLKDETVRLISEVVNRNLL